MENKENKTFGDLFNEVFDNVKHFDFGNNGEGWIGEILSKNNINWKDVEERANELLNNWFNENSSKKTETKETSCEKPCKETCKETCNCGKPVDNTITDKGQYWQARFVDDNFIFEAVINGQTLNDYSVKINKKNNTLIVAPVEIEDNAPEKAKCWYTHDINAVVNLPEKVDYKSFKKVLNNGIMTITAKVKVEKAEDYEFAI